MHLALLMLNAVEPMLILLAMSCYSFSKLLLEFM